MAKAEKKKRNDNSGLKGKAIFYTLGLLALALLIIVASSFFFPQAGLRVRGLPPDVHAPPGTELEQSNFPDGGIDTGFILRIALSVLNVILILYLLFVYVRDYLALRSKFTSGLVVFLFSFLLYALSSLPPVHVFFGRFGMAGVFSFIPMLFSAIGLLVFAKLSNE